MCGGLRTFITCAQDHLSLYGNMGLYVKHTEIEAAMFQKLSERAGVVYYRADPCNAHAAARVVLNHARLCPAVYTSRPGKRRSSVCQTSR